MDNVMRVTIAAIGDLDLNFGRDMVLIWKNCRYVPSIRRNLVLVSKLVKDGYFVYFNDFMVINDNNHFI